VKPRRITRIAIGALAVVTVGLAVRTLVLTGRSIREALQMDFSTYFAAARSLDAGLSPYDNNVVSGARFWDGMATAVHSRYLYPPLTATLLIPLSRLSFGTAKEIWTILSLLAGLAAMLLALSSVGRLRLETAAAVTVLTLAFHPMTTTLERGQIETFILLALMVMVWLERRSSRFAGLPLGLAVLLKPTYWVLVPFLLMRRRFTLVTGAAVMGIALVVLDAFVIGPRLELTYWTNEMSRIAAIDERHEPIGPDLPAAILETLPHGNHQVTMDGKTYQESVLSFSSNATLLRPFHDHLRPVLDIRRSTTSFALMAGALLAIAVTLRKRLWGPSDPDEELAFVLLGLCCALDLGPFTWVMAIILVLPVIVLLPKWWRSDLRQDRVACVAAAVAIVVMGFPEGFGHEPMSRWLQIVKYPVALAVLGGALLFFLSRRPAIAAAPS
jgi:hypothetical protein